MLQAILDWSCAGYWVTNSYGDGVVRMENALGMFVFIRANGQVMCPPRTWAQVAATLRATNPEVIVPGPVKTVRISGVGGSTEIAVLVGPKMQNHRFWGWEA